MLSLDALEDFQGGLKKRGKREVEQIITSLLRFGFSFPFFVWRGEGHNYCLDGHGRIAALSELRRRGHALPAFPVIYVDAVDEAEAKQKLLRLNSQYGSMTPETVLEFMGGLEIIADELALPSGLLKLYSDSETSGDDAIPEAPKPTTELGDVYELSTGDSVHRLVCGDSTDPAVIATLLEGAMADLLLTDPPYNVDIQVSSIEDAKARNRRTDGLGVKNDAMPDSEFHAFLVSAFSSAAAALKSGAAFYIWHADSEGLPFRLACREAALEVRQCLVWNKQAMVMGRQDYQWKHEPCLYGWKSGGAHSWYSDRKQTTVLDFERPSASAEHPTMKPVELFCYQIANSSKGGDIVLDPFLGSGTSVIACEKTNRVCYGVELDPHYCDVIVSRFAAWARENGREPTITRNGEVLDCAGR